MKLNVVPYLPDLPKTFIESVKEAITDSVRRSYEEIIRFQDQIDVLDFYNSGSELYDEILEIFRDRVLVGIKNDNTLTAFEISCYNDIFCERLDEREFTKLLTTYEYQRYDEAPRFIVAAIIFDRANETSVTAKIVSILCILGYILTNLDFFLDPDIEYVMPFDEADDNLESFPLLKYSIVASEERGLDIFSSDSDIFKIEYDKACDNYLIPICEVTDEFYNNVVPDADRGIDISLRDSLTQLDALIGLKSVKVDLEKLLNFLKVQVMREEAGYKKSIISLHMVFTGPPGTGKTTVARILANIYKQIGVLDKGHFTEIDRAGLVGGYLGQTAIKTKDVLDDALGGVLFIDEAYTLSAEDDHFGQEAINTILKYMEDHRDNLIVIVAGYSELMGGFIDSNPGLKSRFNRYINFPNYMLSELLEIFKKMAQEDGYRLGSNVEMEVLYKIKELMNLEGDNFSNARSVRNLFEKVLSEHSSRIIAINATDETSLSLITQADIKAAEL